MSSSRLELKGGIAGVATESFFGLLQYSLADPSVD